MHLVHEELEPKRRSERLWQSLIAELERELYDVATYACNAPRLAGERGPAEAGDVERHLEGRARCARARP
jgi:hypothetical protein